MEMHRKIAEHGERIARLETLGPTIEHIRESVDELVSVYNRGRGAIYMVVGVGAACGAAVHWVIELFSRGGHP